MILSILEYRELEPNNENLEEEKKYFESWCDHWKQKKKKNVFGLGILCCVSVPVLTRILFGA